MVRIIVINKFEPVESALSISAIFHGLWLLVLDWGLVYSTPTPRAFEVVFGVMLIVVGVVVQTAMSRKWGLTRRMANMASFIGWVFATLLIVFTSGFTGIMWIAYTTISVVAAIVYLNVSVGVKDGTQ